MKYDLYIFDLDGTILDTLQDLAISVNYALGVFDFPSLSASDATYSLFFSLYTSCLALSS